MAVTGRKCQSAERAGDQARERLPEPRHGLASREHVWDRQVREGHVLQERWEMTSASASPWGGGRGAQADGGAAVTALRAPRRQGLPLLLVVQSPEVSTVPRI